MSIIISKFSNFHYVQLKSQSLSQFIITTTNLIVKNNGHSLDDLNAREWLVRNRYHLYKRVSYYLNCSFDYFNNFGLNLVLELNLGENILSFQKVIKDRIVSFIYKLELKMFSKSRSGSSLGHIWNIIKNISFSNKNIYFMVIKEIRT